MTTPNPNKQRAGFARAAKLTPQQREEIAQKAAKARWAKKKAGITPALDATLAPVKTSSAAGTPGFAGSLQNEPI